jgi:hypothetical protein
VRQRDGERQTERETDRQRDRQTERERQTEGERQTDRQTDRQRERERGEREREGERPVIADRQTGGQPTGGLGTFPTGLEQAPCAPFSQKSAPSVIHMVNILER